MENAEQKIVDRILEMVKRKEEAGEGRSGTRTLVPQLALEGALSVRRRGVRTSDSFFVGWRAA